MSHRLPLGRFEHGDISGMHLETDAGRNIWLEQRKKGAMVRWEVEPRLQASSHALAQVATLGSRVRVGIEGHGDDLIPSLVPKPLSPGLRRLYLPNVMLELRLNRFDTPATTVVRIDQGDTTVEWSRLGEEGAEVPDTNLVVFAADFKKCGELVVKLGAGNVVGALTDAVWTSA